MEAMMADLRRKEQITDEMLIVGSSAHSEQGPSGTKGQNGTSNDEDRNS
jgi:hypothetical protein